MDLQNLVSKFTWKLKERELLQTLWACHQPGDQGLLGGSIPCHPGGLLSQGKYQPSLPITREGAAAGSLLFSQREDIEFQLLLALGFRSKRQAHTGLCY